MGNIFGKDNESTNESYLVEDKGYINVHISESNSDANKAILDIGAPFCMVSEQNVNKLINSLSRFQKQNIRRKRSEQVFKFGEKTFVKSKKILAFPMIGKDSVEIIEFFVIEEKIPTLIGLNFMRSLGTKI